MECEVGSSLGTSPAAAQTLLDKVVSPRSKLSIEVSVSIQVYSSFSLLKIVYFELRVNLDGRGKLERGRGFDFRSWFDNIGPRI